MSKLLNDPWCLIENHWDPTRVRASESIFSLGNGRFGQRANFEEFYSGDSLQGNYLAGVFYPDKTRVGWWKNGYPEYFAKVLNAVNWIGIDIYVNDERLDLNQVKSVLFFTRKMDMRTGVLQRSFQVELRNGAVIGVDTERFCSMHHPEAGAIKYQIKAISDFMSLRICPSLNLDVKNEDSNWNDAFW